MGPTILMQLSPQLTTSRQLLPLLTISRQPLRLLTTLMLLSLPPTTSRQLWPPPTILLLLLLIPQLCLSLAMPFLLWLPIPMALSCPLTSPQLLLPVLTTLLPRLDTKRTN